MTGQTYKLLTAALSLAMLALLALPATSLAGNCPNANVQPDPGAISQQDYDASILCLLNQVRNGNGLRSLRLNSKLSVAADRHSASMQANSYFAHESPDGAPFTSRIIATGYLKRARAWSVGENLAWGDYQLGTPAALMQGWLNSPPHRANILTRRYRDIGIGTVWGSPVAGKPDLGAIVTTDFGYAKHG